MTAFSSSTDILVPPLNFALLLPGPSPLLPRIPRPNLSSGVYRSGHPNKKNFSFMETLNLKSIMSVPLPSFTAQLTKIWWWS